MKNILHIIGLFCLVLVLASFTGCNDGGGGGNSEEPDRPSNTPSIPKPANLGDTPPKTSDYYTVGVSNELKKFAPYVEELRDGNGNWIEFNRHVRLVCECPENHPDCEGGVYLTENTGDHSISNRTFLSVPPFVLHQRYWKWVNSVPVEAGGASRKAEVTKIKGVTNSTQEIDSFSKTIGVGASAEAAYKAIGLSLEASFEQTETHTEIETWEFEKKTIKTVEETFNADPDHDIQHGVWQLMEVFSIVDANLVPIHQSETLTRAKIRKVKSIVVPTTTESGNPFIYYSTTHF